MNDAQESMNIG